MNSQAKLMIVDDSPDSAMLLRMILENDYEVSEVHSGEECLARVAEAHPDLILLDVSMPGISGYDVCRQIKQTPTTAKIPVIFISAMDLPEERLEGYEAGADEYILKPINIDVVMTKVATTLNQHEKHQRLQLEAREAMSTALEAMTASSEMGVVVQFLKDSNQCSEFVELQAAITHSMTNFGLASCCILFDEEDVLYSECTPNSVEARIIEKCRHVRIYDFGPRTAFSEQHISILVKNMPLDEPHRYGRIKDNVAILASIAESRIKSLQMEMELVGRRNTIVRSLIETTETKLEIVSDHISSHERKIASILQNMINKLEEKLIFLGLEEDQETALRKLAADASDEILQLGTFSEELHITLCEVLEGLYKLLEKPAPAKPH